VTSLERDWEATARLLGFQTHYFRSYNPGIGVRDLHALGRRPEETHAFLIWHEDFARVFTNWREAVKWWEHLNEQKRR
jgi:hypothetical protein